jgi:hypothetical protein
VVVLGMGLFLMSEVPLCIGTFVSFGQPMYRATVGS